MSEEFVYRMYSFPARGIPVEGSASYSIRLARMSVPF
jgi:hypothetical protein